ncbi:MAG: hypothetical protein PHW65_02005 [Dehalococcoidales bacterium]|nr:hypothetical protein [Dehalococcoidales bacterium]
MNKKALKTLLAVITISIFVLAACKPSTPPAAPTTTAPSSPVTTTQIVTATQTVTTTSQPPTSSQLPPTSTPVAPTTSEEEPSTTPPVTSTAPPLTTTTTNPYDAYYHGYLLDGYPEDIWPLYKSLAVDRCDYSILFPVYNDIGYHQNRFSVIYVTEEDLEEIEVYYNGLLETVIDDGFFQAYGYIDGYELQAYWIDEDFDNEIYLQVYLPEHLQLSSNPYLSDFPDFLSGLYEPKDIWLESFTCTSNPPKGTTETSKLYSHNGTMLGALEHYRAILKSSPDFTEDKVEDYAGQHYKLSGTIDSLEVRVTVGVWGKPEMIQITYIKK